MDKYVGEMEAIDFRNSIFSKDGRYTQFTMEDGAQAEHYFTMLMGDDVELRRDYIYENIDWEGTID